MTIGEAETRQLMIGWQLSTDSQDVEFILDYLGKAARKRADREDIRGFFTQQQDGDFTHVYGFKGIVPTYGKELYRFKGAITKQQ